MAINKDRLRQRLANAKNPGAANGFWSPPKTGKTVIRMFPCPHSEDPFLEYFYHFNISNQSIFCPKKNGYASSCALCDLTAELYNSPNAQDKEISKKIFARQRYYGTIIDRADETLTPKYWGFSYTLWSKFMGWLVEDGGDYENFLDTESGLDLVVGVQDVPGKKFAQAEVECKRRESPLGTPAEIASILKSVKPISEVFTSLSEADIVTKCNDYLKSLEKESEEPKGDPEEDSSTEVKGGSKPATNGAAKTSSQDIDDFFNQNGLAE